MDWHWSWQSAEYICCAFVVVLLSWVLLFENPHIVWVGLVVSGIEIIFYSIKIRFHFGSINNVICLFRANVDDRHHGSIGRGDMSLNAWLARKATLLWVMALTQIRAASCLLIWLEFQLVLVCDFERVREPVQHPWLTWIIANHSSRQLCEHRILVESVFFPEDLTIIIFWVDGKCMCFFSL